MPQPRRLYDVAWLFAEFYKKGTVYYIDNGIYHQVGYGFAYYDRDE